MREYNLPVDRPEPTPAADHSTEAASPRELLTRLETAYESLGVHEFLEEMSLEDWQAIYSDHPPLPGQPYFYERGSKVDAIVLPDFHVSGGLLLKMPCAEFVGEAGSQQVAAYLERRALALSLCSGLADFEQVVAFSPEDEAIITLPVEGKSLDDFESEDIAAISEAQLHRLIDSMQLAWERGVMMDVGVTRNFVVNGENRIICVDYDLRQDLQLPSVAEAFWHFTQLFDVDVDCDDATWDAAFRFNETALEVAQTRFADEPEIAGHLIAQRRKLLYQ